jgi:hypothetical protein
MKPSLAAGWAAMLPDFTIDMVALPFTLKLSTEQASTIVYVGATGK